MTLTLTFSVFAKACAILSFLAGLCSLGSAVFFGVLVVLLEVFCLDAACEADTAPGAFFILIAGFLCSFALFTGLGVMILQNERLQELLRAKGKGDVDGE